MRLGLDSNERKRMWLSSLLGDAHHFQSLNQESNDTGDVPSTERMLKEVYNHAEHKTSHVSFLGCVRFGFNLDFTLLTKKLQK